MRKEEKERKQIAEVLSLSQSNQDQDNSLEKDNNTPLETEALKEVLDKVNTKASSLTEKFNQVLNKCELNEFNKI